MADDIGCIEHAPMSLMISATFLGTNDTRKNVRSLHIASCLHASFPAHKCALRMRPPPSSCAMPCRPVSSRSFPPCPFPFRPSRSPLIQKDVRERLIENGLQDTLSTLLESIARTVETPEHRREREKVLTKSVGVEAEAAGDSTDNLNFLGDGKGDRNCSIGGRVPSDQPSGRGDPQVAGIGILGGAGQSYTEGGDFASVAVELKAGPELDELAVCCLGAISVLMRSDEAKGMFLEPGKCVLDVLLELATVSQGRYARILFILAALCAVTCRL